MLAGSRAWFAANEHRRLEVAVVRSFTTARSRYRVAMSSGRSTRSCCAVDARVRCRGGGFEDALARAVVQLLRTWSARRWLATFPEAAFRWPGSKVNIMYLMRSSVRDFDQENPVHSVGCCCAPGWSLGGLSAVSRRSRVADLGAPASRVPLRDGHQGDPAAPARAHGFRAKCSAEVLTQPLHGAETVRRWTLRRPCGAGLGLDCAALDVVALQAVRSVA
jgi:hypothetical protein